MLDLEDHDGVTQHFAPAVTLSHSFTRNTSSLDHHQPKHYCFPQGVLLHRRLLGCGYHVFHLILTGEDGSRLYLNCLKFKEQLESGVI